jgi:hypothetical protein
MLVFIAWMLVIAMFGYALLSIGRMKTCYFCRDLIFVVCSDCLACSDCCRCQKNCNEETIQFIKDKLDILKKKIIIRDGDIEVYIHYCFKGCENLFFEAILETDFERNEISFLNNDNNKILLENEEKVYFVKNKLDELLKSENILEANDIEEHVKYWLDNKKNYDD